MRVGTVLHSHDYRTAEPFAQQNVLVVGCGPSAVDIAIEIAPLAKKVGFKFLLYKSERTKHKNEMCRCIYVIAAIVSPLICPRMWIVMATSKRAPGPSR